MRSVDFSGRVDHFFNILNFWSLKFTVLMFWSGLRFFYAKNTRSIVLFLFVDLCFRYNAGLLDFGLAFVKVDLFKLPLGIHRQYI